MSAYIQEFEELHQYVTWNESALRSTFYDGLWGPVKDLMLAGGVPTELTALKDLALRIDARMESRKSEKQGYAQKSTASHTGGSHNQKNSHFSSSGRPATSAWNNSTPNPRPSTAIQVPVPAQTTAPAAPRVNFPSHTADGTVPMELGTRSGHLTEEEKQYRRRNNLCAYCGDAGHDYPSCPRTKPNFKPKHTKRAAAFNIDITGPTSSTIPEEYTDDEASSENFFPRE